MRDKIEHSEHKVINVDKNGIVYLDTIPVTKETLIQAISARFLENKNLQIFIRADENTTLWRSHGTYAACPGCGF